MAFWILKPDDCATDVLAIDKAHRIPRTIHVHVKRGNRTRLPLIVANFVVEVDRIFRHLLCFRSVSEKKRLRIVVPHAAATMFAQERQAHVAGSPLMLWLLSRPRPRNRTRVA